MKIVALAGQAGTGKSAVASHLVNRFGYVQCALADIMKRFVMDALGFDVVTLWGPSDKRQGVIDSRIQDIALFRGKAKRFARMLLPGDNARAADLGNRLASWAHKLEDYGPEVSARVVLQTLGTEVGRACDEDIWVRYLFEQVIPYVGEFEYKPSLGLLPRAQASLYLQKNGLYAGDKPQGVVISDARFLNEIRGTISRGGAVYRLKRPGMPPGATSAGGVAGHVSETEQESISDLEFSAVLELPEGLDKLATYLDGLWGTKF